MDGTFYLGHLLFGLGIVVEFLRTAGRSLERKDWGNILWSAVIALVVGLRTYADERDIAETLIFFHFAFVLALTIFFRKKILPEIDEIVLFVWMAGFWYLCLSRFGLMHIVSIIALLPSCISLVVGIFRVRMDFLTPIILYVWFLIMSLAVAAMLFPGEELMEDLTFPPGRSFFLGMLFFYALSYLLSVLNFIPIPAKNQTFRERMKEVREHAYLIADKFNDFQHPPLVMLALLAGTAAGLYTNYAYQLVEEKLLLSVVLGLSPMIRKLTGKIVEWYSSRLEG
ncbi:MAG: hypothetical protein HY316_09700 [Acidobacteria bacterium]|nr:hypothetical protein [Acidobacteriota bacterium]